ncbi:DUF84 family protein [Jeotgalibacillus campisalis]|uniref:inosine/xanthosine triphosphatase n=1 Tax=Jeotgalibacillus campisalis TaxID=220754 RepID=A0A0C2VPK3_9BACL|nr:DUF84 family protein [Jeotgalibacillus campisalis]KIL46376.1 NTPase [Jeotgalibacillus campisalis]
MSDSIVIAAGTKNKAKIAAIEKSLRSMADAPFQLEAYAVSSEVSEQPLGDEETMAGAVNRASNALLSSPHAQIGIGLEGGVIETSHGLFLCNWGALKDKNMNAPIFAGGARILLPNAVADELRAGKELGPVMESFSQRKDIRQQEGAIGIFTNGRMTRAEMFSHIVALLYGQWEIKSGKEKQIEKR